MKTLEKSAVTLSTITFDDRTPKYSSFAMSAPVAVRLQDKTWRTAHHYVLGQQFAGLPEEEAIRQATTIEAAELLATANKDKIRKDWSLREEGIIEEVNMAKFRQHPELAELLLSTKDLSIKYRSTDSYLGTTDKGEGLNFLGMVLMKVRRRMRYDAESLRKTEMDMLLEHIATFPEDVPAKVQAAGLFRELELTDEAVALLDAADNVNPCSGPAKYCRCLVNCDLGQIKDAFRDYRLAVTFLSAQECEFYHPAAILLAEGNVSRASELLLEEIDETGKSYLSLLLMNCFAVENNLKVLETALSKALKDYDAISFKAIVSLLELFLESNRIKAATAVFKELVKEYPGFVDAYLRMIRKYADLGMPEEALQVCHMLLAEEPNHAEAYLLAGLLSVHMGYDQLAWKYLRQAVWLDPDNDYTRSLYARVCERIGKMEEAEKYRQSRSIRLV